MGASCDCLTPPPASFYARIFAIPGAVISSTIRTVRSEPCCPPNSFWPGAARRACRSARPTKGKSHLAQAIGWAATQQGHKVLYRETHVLLDELVEAVTDGTRREYMERIATVPLLIIDDFGMRKLPPYIGRGSAGDRDAALRVGEYAADVKPARGRLAAVAGRCGGGERDAGPVTASRTCAQVRSEKLANQDRAGNRDEGKATMNE